MAACCIAASGLTPRPGNKTLKDLAIVVFRCDSAERLKFLGYDVFCAKCWVPALLIKILTSYEKTIVIFEDESSLKKEFNELHELLRCQKKLFAISRWEPLAKTFDRWCVAPKNARGAFSFFLDDAKPIMEILKNG